MAKTKGSTGIYLEIGKIKVFAGALEWPGWCRQGRGEDKAIEALLEAAPRYARIAQDAGLEFETPEDRSSLAVVERLEGSATTDFGAPDAAPTGDDAPIDAGELERLEALLKACWRAFDQSVEMAEGRELRKGPRGGGRELAGIVEHVVESDASYLRQLGWKLPNVREEDDRQRLAQVREGILEGLRAAADRQLPETGPRGGKRWAPRYFVRRVAWHVVDHAWEIEDRAL